MQNALDVKPLPGAIQTKMEQYRKALLSFGMREPSRWESSAWHWRFWKPATEWTAFVVNLSGREDSVEVVFGYASTAFTRFAGDENALAEWGVSNENITLRQTSLIRDEKDEKTAGIRIAEEYRKHLHTQKEDLLDCAKEKRKAFIQQITLALKQLGFRKKANTWTKPLEGDFYVSFNAQKSAFSDEYYFNVYIGKNGTSAYGDCYSARVAPMGQGALDWQTISEEKFASFLNQTVVPVLEEIIRTPLKALGKKTSYWFGCRCEHRRCDSCWMEKNAWEAKETHSGVTGLHNAAQKMEEND